MAVGCLLFLAELSLPPAGSNCAQRSLIIHTTHATPGHAPPGHAPPRPAGPRAAPGKCAVALTLYIYTPALERIADRGIVSL